jgi:hypothetical protein
MRVAPVTRCGLRTADCGWRREEVVLQPTTLNPLPLVGGAVPSDLPDLMLPAGVVSFDHWLDLNA